MTTQHTPGPWTAKNSPGAGLGVWADLRPALGERYSKDFPLIGSESLPAPKVQIAYETWVQFPSDQWNAMQKANMYLIAAAPDLLAALQYIERGLSAAHPEGCAELNKARAAIAKATQQV